MLMPGAGRVCFEFVGEPAEVIFLGFEASEPMMRALRKLDTLMAISSSPVHAAVYTYLLSLTRVMTQSFDENGTGEVLWKLTREAARALVNAVVSEAVASPLGEKDELIERARSAIEEHHGDVRFNGRTLARQLDVSARVLQLRFREVGSTVSDEVRRRRAQTAVDLIEREPGLPLDAVAQAAGFRSREVLRSSIVRYFGVVPSRLREPRDRDDDPIDEDDHADPRAGPTVWC